MDDASRVWVGEVRGRGGGEVVKREAGVQLEVKLDLDLESSAEAREIFLSGGDC